MKQTCICQKKKDRKVINFQKPNTPNTSSSFPDCLKYFEYHCFTDFYEAPLNKISSPCPFSPHRLAPVFSLFVPFYLLIPRMQVTQVLSHIHITNKSLVYIVGLQVSLYSFKVNSNILLLSSWLCILENACFYTRWSSLPLSSSLLLLFFSCWLPVPSCGYLHSVDWWVANFLCTRSVPINVG